MFTYHQLANSSFTIGASEVVLSTGELALTTGVTVSGVQVIEAIGLLAGCGSIMLMSKNNPGMKSNPPVSWTTTEEGIEAMLECGSDANKAADKIMNNHEKKLDYGAGTERNAIKKWLDRVIRKIIRMGKIK